MAAPIQKHHRENHERTDDLLHQVRSLVTALEAADDATTPRERLDQYAQAVPCLIGLINEKLDELNVARGMEWVGLGGSGSRLTSEQLADALPKGGAA